MSRILTLAGCLALLGACSDDPVETPDATTTGGSDAGRDRAAGEVTDDIRPGEARWTKPDGYASITFVVDDTANGTYADADMEWNASLIYDRVTNTVEHSDAWLPEQGPFPPLYDDGPYSQGGHEAVGQTAGDHIFSAEVFFLAEEDTTFEYGLINDLDHWIWVGPNGRVTVTTGETGTVDAPGYTFPAFGDIDLKVTLDTAELHEEFAFDPAENSLFVKGSMISWKPVQILDNGERGDEAADDGIYTLTLSEYLGPHDGLLTMGQEAQFVFVFVYEEGTEGVEYKLAGNALPNGVAAYSDWDSGQPGVYLEEEVLLRPESRGRALNTSVLIGPDDDLPGGDPVLRFVDPDRGPAAGGTVVDVTGENFADGATVTFDTTEATCSFENATLLTCTTPAHAAGTVGVTVENPDGDFDTHEIGFTYLDEEGSARVDSVDPPRGGEWGGWQVTINGGNFEAGATVSFGGELATNVDITSSTTITCEPPGHGPGSVAVSVQNTGSSAGSLNNAYTYEPQGVDFATIQWPTDDVTGTAGVALATLYGRVYQAAVTDSAGAGAGIQAELIYAPEGSANPSEDDSTWTTVTMVYNTDKENDDEYKVEGVIIPTAGTYLWGVRFSQEGTSSWTHGDEDGSRNGFELSAAGRIIVSD